MTLRDRVANFFGGGGWEGHAVPRPFADRVMADLPLNVVDDAGPVVTLADQRDAAVAIATLETADRRAAVKESLSMAGGFAGLDNDEGLYRRLTTGAKFQRRDLTPLQQDRALEVTWYLWEQNPFARRLVTLMTDLIVGEGVTIEAEDEQVQAQIDKTWAHPTNLIGQRVREFHNFLSLTGELVLPVTVNPITGRPVMGFIDPYQIKQIIPADGNALMPDMIELKPLASSGNQMQGERLKIIRVNPVTDRLEGEVFFFKINSLPNSLRGRPDLLALADWLDLYDQYMFAEVERLQLLSSFVWDLTVKGADEKKIQERLAKFPVPKPGTIYAHNENEELDARTPELNATDRSEVARLLRLHIAGSMGFPLSYLGDIDSNKSTIEGQSDVMMKTPAARQKEFGIILGTIAEFVIQSTTRKNPALFNRGAAGSGFKVKMPEIQSKDIARVGQVLAQVASANDTAMANGTMSKRAATVVQVTLVKHLGVDLDPNEVEKDAQNEADARQAKADEIQANMAAAMTRNPPVPGDDDDEEDDAGGQQPKPKPGRRGARGRERQAA